MQKLLFLALAGALGTLARYGLSGLVQRSHDGSFPWGTLAVNVAGCFLFGVLWSVGEERFMLGGEVRTLTLIGFMGAFTTFSTFAFETGQFLRESQWLMAAGNLTAQNVSGFVSLLLGQALGRLL